MRRRLLLILAALVAVLLVAVATVPLWLGAAARAIGGSRGLTFASYERIGYGRFALNDVEYRRPGVRVSVSRAEAPTPVVWLWRHLQGDGSPILAARWEVEVTKVTPPKPRTTEPGWMPLRRQLQRIATQLDRWLPQAQTGPGLVRFPGGEIAVAAAKWAERELAVTELKYRTLTANATVAFSRTEDLLRLRARAIDDATSFELESRGANVAGEVNWSEQRAALTATFAPRGWLPTEANINATDWAVPGDKLKVGQLYALVRGSARIEWRAERFVANVNAASEPVAGKSAPPLKVDLRGQGDARAFTVEALQVELPGVSARLSEPVTLDRGGKLRDAGARLMVQADLAEQPWFTATGAVKGEARVVSGASAMPRVEFELSASNVVAKDVNLAAVSTRGEFAWPRLEIGSVTVIAGEGERLEGRGGWDFKTKEILEATVEGRIRRRSIARWVPKQPLFDVVTLSARASGRVAELQHSGRAEASEVTFRGVNPLAFGFSWKGRGIGAERIDVEAAAGGAKIIATGTATREAVRLTSLDFTQGGELRLKLEAPATLRWKPAVQLESFHLTGPQGNLNVSLTAGESGNVELAAANISSRWFTDFVPPKGPAWQLNLFALMGSWNRGPMNFSITAGATVEIGEGRTAAVNAAARGDKDGLRIEALRATEGDATVVNATGRVPVTLNPGTMAELFRIDENGPVMLAATAAPHAAFWQKLAAVSGVELLEPDAVANVQGTWRRPEGSVSLKAARIAIDPKKVARPLPSIEHIDVRLVADRGGVMLERFSFAVEGQPVRARGRLPVADDRWEDLFKQPLEFARRGADFELEVPEAEVAVFERFLPRVLAPQGRVEARVTFKNGDLGGYVRLRNAASRPLGPLGVLQEVSAELEMSGRTLLLRGVTARSGGQPVRLSGSVELPEGGAPRFDLALKGENLPFVRQTGLLLRGDLDLKLQTPNTGPPRLTGVVRLRDSLFLSDVRSFIPTGGASASRRPPYFSVDTPPVDTWGLAVEVTGEKFMRLRTPVFQGVASARFRLSGTLKEPRAIGEVEIDEGVVRMPFARFEVQQGSVRLTEADPYEPTIYLRATGRRYDYDLTLEIDGKASAPNVVFNSSPALESEQVLLMVTTGTAPSNEIAVTGTQRMTRLGTYVGQNLLSSFTSDGADADRLTITSGERISRQGKETYDIQYKLTDKWTVTGEYNEFDEYNGGFKWRIFRGKPEEAKPANGEK